MYYINALSNNSLNLFRGLLEKTQRIMNSTSDATVLVCAGEALWSLANQTEASRIHAELARLAERQTVVALASLLMHQKLDESEKNRLIQAIADIPMAERQPIFDLARPLMHQEMDGFEKYRLIKIIARIPIAERQTVIDLAFPLMLQQWDRNKPLLIETIACIPMAERQTVIDLAHPLIPQEASIMEKALLITAIARIRMRERQNVVAMALPLMHQEMGSRVVEKLLEKIAQIPQEERMAVVEEALLLNPEIPVIERIYLAQRHLQRARLPFGAQPNLINLAAEGINVHDDNRDRRTGEAVVLLRRHQGYIEEEQILAAKDAFTAYLHDSSRTPAIKQKAQRALEGTPRAEDEEYGSLIDGVEFGLQGPTIRGDELIGRLWIYAESLSETDSINAKEAMISALADSYNFNQTRVCNQGKAQRLVLAVLQGNLEGVSIEEQRRENAPAPLNPSVTQFFNIEANKRIDNLAELLVAADLFLKQNELVDREPFLREIREYGKWL